MDYREMAHTNILLNMAMACQSTRVAGGWKLVRFKETATRLFVSFGHIIILCLNVIQVDKLQGVCFDLQCTI